MDFINITIFIIYWSKFISEMGETHDEIEKFIAAIEEEAMADI